jgi:hypothetical protein
MDITSNFFDKFGRKHLWFDLFQQIIKFSAELNFYNFAENIIKKYGRKSQILGGERPPLPPLNREPCSYVGLTERKTSEAAARAAAVSPANSEPGF